MIFGKKYNAVKQYCLVCLKKVNVSLYKYEKLNKECQGQELMSENNITE